MKLYWNLSKKIITIGNLLKIIKDIQLDKWWVVNWINDNFS